MGATLKIIFAGTPDFAASALSACISSRHEVTAVYTQPDRPSGRGRKKTYGPVKQLAVNANLPVHQPDCFSPEQQEILSELKPDVMLVSAYGSLLPQAVLDIPKLGCINIHASLLPKWRGAAPIQRAIIAGDSHTGISMMQMVEELDAGPVLKMFDCEISPTDTGSSLHDRLAKIAEDEIVQVLENLADNKLIAKPQDHNHSSYAKKLSKQEANINWPESAVLIERKIRAFNAWPIAYTFLNNQRLRIWKAEVNAVEHSQQPGLIMSTDNQAIQVAAGEGAVNIISLQLAGGKVISAQDFINTRSLAGQQFTAQAVENTIRTSA